MNIIVTGGAGFIGSHLVDALAERGLDVVVIDNLSTGRRENLPRNVSLIEADVRDADKMEAIFSRKRPSLVFHLAAQMNVRRSLVDPRLDADVNILGSLAVFKAAARSRARRVLFASSGGAIYGEQQELPCRESAVPSPSSPYGIAKLAVELYGRQHAEVGAFDFVALRLANVYGPLQNPEGEAGVVSLFLSNLLEGRSSAIFGDGEQTRDFVWVGDVVDAFLKGVDGPPGVYNVGTGQETGVLELYRRLERLTGTQLPPRWLAAIPGEVRRNVLSADRARTHLGWTARQSLRDGLDETVKSVRSSYSAARSS